MNIKDKLQIYLITYNRKKYLQRTFEQIFADNSPIKDYDITILDNASTDGTSELIEEYKTRFPNITHIRHSVNIGGNANICRAFEMGATCGKEYFWVLCDDDKYDFSNWSEVEEEMQKGTDIICLADYIYDTAEKKTDPAYQIFQLTFVPAGIFKSTLITDDILIAMYDNIYTMFQQSAITINTINKNGLIKVLSKPVVFNGLHFEDNLKERIEDLSYTRGSKDKFITERKAYTSWILGFSSIITLLHDKNIQYKCLEVAIPYKDIYGSWDNFWNCMRNQYIEKGNSYYFWEIYDKLPKNISEKYKCGNINSNSQYFYLEKRLESVIYNLDNKTNNIIVNLNKPSFIQQLFSVKNENNHKIIRLLGFKLKFYYANNKKTKNKISFFQYVFSVRNIEQHKVLQILGIKFKFKNKKV